VDVVADICYRPFFIPTKHCCTSSNDNAGALFRVSSMLWVVGAEEEEIFVRAFISVCRRLYLVWRTGKHSLQVV
jgi:hypothetical protein